MSESAKRVVITGLGLVSPIGIGIDRFEAELTAGRSGIAPISLIPYSAAPGGIGAEVRDLTDETAKTKWLKGLRTSFKVYSRDIQLGVLAAILGLEHSGLKVAELTHERIGVEFGSNQMYSPPDVLQGGADACADENHEFHFDRWGQTGLHAMEPLWLLKYLPNMPSCHISILADARGPSNSLTLNEASGNASIGEAIRIMRRGQADVMITGATGTRTASITGAYVALHDAVERLLQRKLLGSTPILDQVAAVSVGIYQGVPVLDLDYPEDSSCDTDMNVVMTGHLGLVEVQGTAEGITFDRQELNAMLDLAQQGIQQLIAFQKAALAEK